MSDFVSILDFIIVAIRQILVIIRDNWLLSTFIYLAILATVVAVLNFIRSSR